MKRLPLSAAKRTPSFLALAAIRAAMFAIAVTVFAATLFVSCASAPPPAERREIAADFAGVVHAGSTRTQQEFAYLEYMNVKWILHTFNWSSIEPEPGLWTFQAYDDLVGMANDSEIKVLGILAYDNWWIHPKGKTHFYIPPEGLPDFCEYVRRTVEHFRGRVDAWCIWNEPNFFFWEGTDQEFFELMRQAANAVREVDSEVTLLGGAFNRGVFGLPTKFIRGLFETGAMEKVDAVAFHPYELNPSRAAQLYDKFRDIVNDYGFSEKIWITEVGYPTGGWYPTRVSQKKLPAYVVKTMTLLASRGSKRIIWYELFDPVDRKRRDSEHFFGLVRSKQDYTSKGSEAFRLCATFFQGTMYDPQKIQREGIKNSLQAFYFVHDPGEYDNSEALPLWGGVLVLWNEGAGTVEISLDLPGNAPVLHDPVSGAASPFDAETPIKIGNTPVFITWQLGKDAPCIIKKR